MQRRLLVVDDETEILSVVKLIFESQDFQVVCKNDVNDIFSVISEFQPEVILLDITLGSTDGRAVCAELKYTEATKYIPIILFSATPRKKADVIRWGADDFIDKPFDVFNLLATVNGHLK